MKKILFIFSFILVTSLQLPVTVLGLSFSDIFPPLKMEQNPVRGNPPTTDVKNLGTQGVSNKTFTNTLEDSVSCHSTVTVDNSWSGKEENLLDKFGKIIGTIIKPYNANDLSKKKDWNDISNPFTDIVGKKWANRGQASADTATKFKEMGLEGYGAYEKTFGIQMKRCLQSKAIEMFYLSFEKNGDTDYPDLQRGWDCGGVFKDMNEGDKSCRPVTIGEVVYFFSLHPELDALDPLLYDSCETMNPIAIPDFGNYPTFYKQNFKKDGYILNLLPGEEGIKWYTMLRDQLPVKGSGPSNQEVIVTNYTKVCNQWPNFAPCDEEKDKNNRLLPAGASAGNPNLSNFISSVTNPKTVAKKFDCQDYMVVENDPEVQDTPTQVSFLAYVTGLVRSAISDTKNWAFHYNNPLVVKTSTNLVEQVEQTAGDYFNMIPANYENYDKLVAAPASSKTEEEAPIDPGYQASETFKCMRAFLLPESWQNDNTKCLY